MVNDLEQAKRFSNLLYHLHAPLAEEVVSCLSMNGERCLMDLGGGSGVLSLAMLHRYPGLQAVVVDIPNVCQAGREIADATPEGSRIHYYPADFLRDPLPGSFDLVFECDVSNFTTELFEKVRASLNPGGRFVIIDRWFENEHLTRRGHLGYLLRNSLKNPEFTLPALQDVIDSLHAAGLVVVGCKNLPQHHWLMIESMKD
jgi:SAM-dependent methyltransferase